MDQQMDVCVCDFVHVKRNGTDGTAYPLIKKSELVLGRGDTCDFKVQVPSACDRHAKLRVDVSGKVFVSSLVSTVPVSLNGAAVLKETPVADKSIISVGSCNFRFIYREGFATSPLMQSNTPAVSPARKPRKSTGTPKSKDKENVATLRSPARRSLSHTPRPSTPASSVGLNRSRGSSEQGKGGAKSARPLTPTSAPGSKKKGRVATPTVARARHSSTHSSFSSLSSSLFSIAEETTPQAAPTNITTSDSEASSSSSKKARRTATPTIPRGRSSRSRASSSMSTSLMSIQEEDESLASPPSSPPTHQISTGPFMTTAANATFKWLSSVNPLKPASRRSVSFGPALSPEVFLRHMPPSTPVRAGKVPGGLRRSLPAKPESLEFVAEANEEEGEEEEEMEEGEGEMVEYSMTGFEEASSDDEEDTDEGEESASEEPCEGGELDATPVASPGKKPALPTPPRRQIQSKPSLRQRYRKLGTPLRRAIQDRPWLRSTRRALPTPLRRAIKGGSALRKTHRSLPTPVRSGIQSRPSLHRARRALRTPVRRQIESMPELRKTKRCLPTPLRQEIQGEVAPRKTKRCMPTPLRKEIRERPALRQTRGRGALATPVRKEIESRPTLRKTRNTLATPVRREIEAEPKLKKTKKSMPTPVRAGIEARPTLRKTRNTLATPVRREIEAKPELRKTKKSMPTPVRRGIESRPTLHKTKLSLPTPLRAEIQSQPQLRKTKRSLPTPLRHAIQRGPALRPTKKPLPPDLLQELKSRPALRKTKPTLPTPLRGEIRRGISLRSLRATESRSKRAYADTVAACETPVPAPPAKRRKIANTPLPYSLTPAATTSPRPPAKASKRDYATTLLASETPVPAPPAKRMKIASSPSLPTPKSYDFGVYLQPEKDSQDINLTGLPRLFKSPRVCHSSDPAEVFEVRLFGESREVCFSSPLATSSKRPASRPNSAQGLASCMKNVEQCLFTIGAPDPPREKRGRGQRSRNVSAATTTRVTRSRSRTQEAPPPAPPTTRRRGKSATTNPEKENAGPLPAVAPLATRRSSRLKTSSAAEETVVVAAPTRPRKRGTVAAPIKEEAAMQTQKPNITEKTEGIAAMPTQMSRRSARVASDRPSSQARQPTTEGKNSEPEVGERRRRQSCRLAGIPTLEAQPKSGGKKQPMEVAKERGSRKTRQAARQEAMAVDAPAKPSTRSAREKLVSSTTVAPRRSSRLRK